MRRWPYVQFLKFALAIAVLTAVSACGRGFLLSKTSPTTITTTSDFAPKEEAPKPISVDTFSGKNEQAFTGFTKTITAEDGATKVEVPYVAAGQVSDLDDLKRYLGQDADENLGRSVTAVDIKWLDSHNQPVTTAPIFADVTITLKDQTLNFHADLSASSDHLVARDTKDANGNLLSLACGDSTCARSLLILSKSEHSKIGILYTLSTPNVSFEASNNTTTYKSQTFQGLMNKTIQAQRISVAVYPGPSFSKVEIPKIDVPKVVDAPKSVVAPPSSTPTASSAPVSTTPATPINAQSTVTSPNDQVAPIAAPPAPLTTPSPSLEVDFDQLATETISPPVNKVVAEADKNISGTLFGENPDTKSVIADLSENGEYLRMHVEEPDTSNAGSLVSVLAPQSTAPDTTAPADQASSPDVPASASTPPPKVPPIHKPKPRPATPPPAEVVSPTPPPTQMPVADTTPQSTLFLKPTDAQKYPSAVAVSNGFARYENNAYVKQLVKAWLGTSSYSKPSCSEITPSRSKLDGFLQNAPNVSELFGEVTLAVGVTPEIGYLLPLESNYLIDGNFSAGQTNPKSTACGPMQIENPASIDAVKFASEYHTGFRLIRTNQCNKNDDRYYFLNSGLMSAHYFMPKFQRFLNDPALAIAAYRGGDEAGERIYRALRLDKFPFSLESAIQSHVNIGFRDPEEACKDVSYALNFLALRAIGQNLEKNHLQVTPVKTEKFKENLQNPQNPLVKI